MLFLAVWISVSAARNQCPARDATIEGLRSKGECLESWTRLAPALIAARYHSPEFITEVLYESRGGRVRPLWVVQLETEIAEIDEVKLHRVGRSRIVEVLDCVHGTGGCWQDFALLQPHGDAKPIANPRPLFNAKLPPGTTTYKAPMVDLDAMTIHGFGWAAHDANGSPSREMTCRVTFDGEAFALSRCATRPTPASP